MSRATSAVAQRVVDAWATVAEPIATAHRLPLDLVLAVVCQESAGNSGAYRDEPGFWRRYGANVVAFVRRTVTRTDDRWLDSIGLRSASFGLMQVLWPVALERGLVLTYPTELCVPAIGLDAGCRHLRYCVDAVGGDVAAGLLRYNGGGAPAYDDEVLAWRDMVRADLDARPAPAPPVPAALDPRAVDALRALSRRIGTLAGELAAVADGLAG